MFIWLKKKFYKASVLLEITNSETTHKHREPYDFWAQESIRERMKQAGYTYIGNPGKADATNPKSYKP